MIKFPIMKKGILLTLILASCCQYAFAQLTLPPSGDNQKSVVTQYIGSLAHVTITYNSPDVHSPSGEDRTGKIWGQLVPYGLNDLGFGLRNPSPWRAGANENTVIEFSHDMQVQGKSIKAGTYGLHIIAEATGPWTIIFSNNSDAWGSYFYKASDDALRVTATPKDTEYHEWLTYEFIDRQPTEATVAMIWEKKMLSFTISVPKMNELYVQNIRRELEGPKGFTWTNWDAAANFALQNDIYLEEGLSWAESAISAPFIGNENFQTLSTKAQILAKLKRLDEAEDVMDKAIHHGSASVFQIHNYGRQLISLGYFDKALSVMQYNAERFENAWPTHVGLARAYSAKKDYVKALEHAKLGLEQAPDQLNKDFLKGAIDKLMSGQDIN